MSVLCVTLFQNVQNKPNMRIVSKKKTIEISCEKLSNILTYSFHWYNTFFFHIII